MQFIVFSSRVRPFFQFDIYFAGNSYCAINTLGDLSGHVSHDCSAGCGDQR